MVLYRRDYRALLMLGIVGSIALTLGTNPIVEDIPRTAVLPALPAFFVGAAMALTRLTGYEPFIEHTAAAASRSYAQPGEHRRELITEP